ncbi:methyltransferase [Candidatus Woesearchaeota archaeon]|nr:methyltransferase [Candidatus Woesearchaeota archaeon]
MALYTDIYEPAEDSYLLQKVVRGSVFGRVLDIGTGSGIQAMTAVESSRVREVVAVDINPEAVERLQARKIRKLTVFQSDLFEHVEGQFNCIIFNPPYLPQDPGVEDAALYGGKKGWEITERFFRDASRYLHADGKIFFLFSTLTNKEKIEELLQHFLFSFEESAREKIAFEELFVYEIKKTSLLRQLEAKGLESIGYYTEGKRGIIYKARLSNILNIKSFIASRASYIDAVIKVKKEKSEAENTIQKESLWLERVNRLGIGPRLVMKTDVFVVTEFVNGENLPVWLERHPAKECRAVLQNVLQQCFILDQQKITKEEMHHPYKHIIVSISGKPVLLDFERCHDAEKPQNVTQFVEYICRLKPLLEKNGLVIDVEKLRVAAKEYKDFYTSDFLAKIIKLL